MSGQITIAISDGVRDRDRSVVLHGHCTGYRAAPVTWVAWESRRGGGGGSMVAWTLATDPRVTLLQDITTCFVVLYAA